MNDHEAQQLAERLGRTADRNLAEQFEAFIRREHPLVSLQRSGAEYRFEYVNHDARLAWAAWQAARTSGAEDAQ